MYIPQMLLNLIMHTRNYILGLCVRKENIGNR